MSENKIKVTASTSKPTRVSVSTSNSQGAVSFSQDTSAYNAKIAEQWATSENLVLGQDYSSKYYANSAKSSAENSQSYANSARETYTNFVSDANNYIAEVVETKDSAIAEVESKTSNVVGEIETKGQETVNAIETTKNNAISSIDKETEQGKKEIKDSVGNLKVLTTLKIGQIGIAPLGIDETLNMERYLNGQIIIQDQFKGFTNYLKRRVELYPSIACLEDEWQAIVANSDFSQCGKFVIDDNAGTIRLPKVVNIQGLTDLSKLAEIVEAGLPNITGNTDLTDAVSIYKATQTGAFTTKTGSSRKAVSTGSTTTTEKLAFDASRSSAVYGKSITVQQEQIQYPYFIQVATGAETEDNIINEIELNNPFSLLDYKFSEYELNNISWLRSNGQYNSKVIYPAVYDLLLKIYNGTETKAGVSVKLTTEEYTDTDFVLNTSEETFRLPIKVKLASGKAVVGNGKALGLTNGSQNCGIHTGSYSSANGIIYTVLDDYDKEIGTSSSGGSNPTSGAILGITTNPTKSGIETSDSDLYLYFYVGETVQNANLINAGRIEEKVASLIPNNSSLISGWGMPSSKSINLTLGATGTTYTAPANGWFLCRRTSTAAGQYLQIANNTREGIQLFLQSGAASIVVGGYIPVQKGDTILIAYTLGSTSNQMFKFIYAQGEV